MNCTSELSHLEERGQRFVPPIRQSLVWCHSWEGGRHSPLAFSDEGSLYQRAVYSLGVGELANTGGLGVSPTVSAIIPTEQMEI